MPVVKGDVKPVFAQANMNKLLKVGTYVPSKVFDNTLDILTKMMTKIS